MGTSERSARPAGRFGPGGWMLCGAALAVLLEAVALGVWFFPASASRAPAEKRETLPPSANPPAAGPARPGGAGDARDIRKLSQHFIDPTDDVSPWVFYPKDNIKRLTTREARGLLLIEDAGRGNDVK